MLDQFGGDLRDLWDRMRWVAHDYGTEGESLRVILTGLAGAGKKTLFNTLWGREVVHPGALPLNGADFGLFKLVDLPCELNDSDLMLYPPPIEDASLIVYLLNSVRGLSAEDFGWIARLRVGRTPLLVILNQIADVHLDDQHAIETELALRILPFHANDPAAVRGVFMDALLKAAPDLAVPLAAQVVELRAAAAQRMIRQATLWSMAVSMEPLPLIDVPVLIGLQLHLIRQIGALYGHRVNGLAHQENAVAILFGLLLRYSAQTLLKLIPWGGWFISGMVGASATWAVGQGAVLYYEEALPPLSEVRDQLHAHTIKRLRG